MRLLGLVAVDWQSRQQNGAFPLLPAHGPRMVLARTVVVVVVVIFLVLVVVPWSWPSWLGGRVCRGGRAGHGGSSLYV